MSDAAKDQEGLTFELRFPARSGFLRICRMNTATAAAELDFSIDAIDDLRLAVVEAVTWLLADEEAGGSIVIEFRQRDGGLRIEARREGSSQAPAELDELMHAIFGATVDRYDVSDSSAPQRRIVLDKHPDLVAR